MVVCGGDKEGRKKLGLYVAAPFFFFFWQNTTDGGSCFYISPLLSICCFLVSLCSLYA